MIKSHYDKFLFILVLAAIALSARGALRSDGPAEMPEPRTNVPALQANVSGAVPPEAPSGADIGVLSSADASPTVAFERANNNLAPSIDAEAGIVADLATGQIYFDLNADKVWPIASLTKLMTAANFLRLSSGRSFITLQEQDFTAEGGDIGRRLHVGESYSSADLFKAMLLFSSNEAADALANSLGRARFLNGMNELAHSWGLDNTSYKDPTGLSPANQSSAVELVRLVREIRERYPEIFKTTRNPSLDITELNANTKSRIYSNNQFVTDPNFLGGKTGYTDEARQNLLTVFSHGGRAYVIVVLGVSGDRFAETAKLRDWFIHTYKAAI